MNALKLFKYIVFHSLWAEHQIAPAIAAAGIGALGSLAGGLFGGKSDDAPSAADMIGLAKKQAQYDQESARTSAMANRPDMYGPGGTTTWESGIGGDPDKWASTQTLTPEGQRAFESSQRMQTGLS